MSEHSSHNVQKLKKHIEDAWKPTNRRAKDPIDATTFVLGWIIVALFVGVALAQVAIHFGWKI